MAAVAPSVRSVTSGTQPYFGDNILSLGKPAGTIEGDVMVAFINGATSTGQPSGWTLLESNSSLARCFYKVAGSSEPSSYDFAVSDYGVGGIVCVKDIDQAQVFCTDTTAENETGDPDNVYSNTGITTDDTNTLLLVSARTREFDTPGPTHTAPSGFTEQFDIKLDTGSGPQSDTMAVSSKAQAAQGATGSVDGSWNHANCFNRATILVGIRGVQPVTHQAEAVLQAAATFTAEANATWRAEAVLQAAATFQAEADNVPDMDFTVYDGYLEGAGIDGVMGLVYFEGQGANADTVSKRLQPPRTDIGDKSNELRPESGNVVSQHDFSRGSEQEEFHHVDSDPRRFAHSEGFDIDEAGILRHLHDVPAATVSSANIGVLAQFNDLLFVADGTNVKRGDGTIPGSYTNEDPSGAEGDVTVNDLVSSGEHLYAAIGTGGIHRRDTAGTWTHWSDIQATRLGWVKNRIVAANSNIIYEVVSVPAVPTALETLPAGWTFEDISEAGGFIYAVAVNPTSGLSRIITYGLNTAGSALEKKSETPFPNDQLMYAVRGYLGAVIITGGKRNSSGGYDPVCYLAFPQENGSLAYTKIAEGKGAGTSSLYSRAIEPIGEDVLIGWSLGTSNPYNARDGLAIYHLSRNAFAHHLKKSSAAQKRVRSILVYKGVVFFTLESDGLYYEDVSKFVASATLVSSGFDWSSTVPKAWDVLELHHNPLPSGTNVKLEYTKSAPEDASWLTAFINSVTGSESEQARLTGLLSRVLAVRITSSANGAQTSAPEVQGYLARSNLVPEDPEFDLVRYVRIQRSDRKDDNAPEVFAYGDVHDQRRTLHRLANQIVVLYEPGVVWRSRVASIRDVSSLIPEYDETTGEARRAGFILQLNLEGVRD